VEGVNADANLGAIWILIRFMGQRTRGEAVDVEDQAMVVRGKGSVNSLGQLSMVRIIPFSHEPLTLNRV
jgi:hypothetical protein